MATVFARDAFTADLQRLEVLPDATASERLTANLLTYRGLLVAMT